MVRVNWYLRIFIWICLLKEIGISGKAVEKLICRGVSILFLGVQRISCPLACPLSLGLGHGPMWTPVHWSLGSVSGRAWAPERPLASGSPHASLLRELLSVIIIHGCGTYVSNELLGNHRRQPQQLNSNRGVGGSGKTL
jgi:hypothetical protein